MRFTGAILFIALIFGAISTSAAQEANEQNPTVIVLETKVAKLETRVARQRTVIATLSPPTPTATATPLTPEGNPVTVSNGVEVLYYYFLDGRVPEVLGELRNPADDPIKVSLLAVEFTLLDGQGNVVDQVPAEVPSTIIPPHQTMPFVGSWVNTANRPQLGDWATEQITVNVIGVSPDTNPSLSVSEVTERSKTADDLTVSGWVTNNGDSATGGLVEVIAAGYDENGRFVGYVFGQIATSIPSGKKAKFTVSSFGDFAFEGLATVDDPTVYTYRLFVRDFENS